MPSLVDTFPRPLQCSGVCRLAASADEVWAVIGNLHDETITAGLAERIEVHGEGVGAERTVFLPGGAGAVRERIEEFNAVERYYVYRIIDVGPLSLADYLGLARVTPAGPHASVLSWSAQARPVTGREDETRSMLQANIDHICKVMIERFGT